MSLISCDNYYFAGLLLYSGYPLVEVRHENQRSIFLFEMEQWSYDEMLTAFESEDGQPVTSVRHYTQALKSLDTRQRLAKKDEFGIWSSLGEKKTPTHQTAADSEASLSHGFAGTARCTG